MKDLWERLVWLAEDLRDWPRNQWRAWRGQCRACDQRIARPGAAFCGDCYERRERMAAFCPDCQARRALIEEQGTGGDAA